MQHLIDVVVFRDLEGRPTRLTTQAPHSRDGLPLLVVDAMGVTGVFGPKERLGIPPGGMMHAAELVAYWAKQPGRSAVECTAARLFLRQWSEGPQLEFICAQQGETADDPCAWCLSSLRNLLGVIRKSTRKLDLAALPGLVILRRWC